MNSNSTSSASRRILVILALLLFIVALTLVILQSSLFRQTPSSVINSQPSSEQPATDGLNVTNTNIVIPEIPPGPSEEAVQNLLNPPSSQQLNKKGIDPLDPNYSTFKETPGEHGTQPSGEQQPTQNQ